MKRYRVVVRDASGRKRTEIIEAESVSDLNKRLEEQKLFLISEPKLVSGSASSQRSKKKFVLSKPKQQDLIVALTMFVTLLESGVRVVDALDDTVRATPDRKLKDVFLSIKRRILTGSSLAQAFSLHPHVFDVELIEALRVGEATGDLTNVLRIQIQRMEHMLQIRRQLKQQSIYPAFLVTLVVLVFSVVTLYFIPKLTQAFKAVIPNGDLPPRTEMIMAVNNFIVDHGLLVVISFILLISSWFLSKYFEPTKRIRDQIIWKLPVFGKATLFLELARACQTLHTGLSAGLTVIDCLTSIHRGATNYVFELEAASILDKVSSGLKLSQAVSPERTDYLFAAMVRAGEQSGRLSATMQQAMEYYFASARRILESSLQIMAYFVIIFLGIIVGWTILSVIIPMYELPSMIV